MVEPNKDRPRHNMKHTEIFKDPERYASFPLVTWVDGALKVRFFVAPQPDHMGVFDYYECTQSSQVGNMWHLSKLKYTNARAHYDGFSYNRDGGRHTLGSLGFFKHKGRVLKSTSFDFMCCFGKTRQQSWEITGADIVVTFPRVSTSCIPWLVPGYAMFHDGSSISYVLRSNNKGESWRLYQMFPDHVNTTEVTFLATEYDGVLAHARLLNGGVVESWSQDGITWTYPVPLNTRGETTIVYGPTHLLQLKDKRILCTYGYRSQPMGIRAKISENQGRTWGEPIILRDDGGYRSSLHPHRWLEKNRVHPANDIGYPVSVQLDDGRIFTVYYITQSDGITSIQATEWRT